MSLPLVTRIRARSLRCIPESRSGNWVGGYLRVAMPYVGRTQISKHQVITFNKANESILQSPNNRHQALTLATPTTTPTHQPQQAQCPATPPSSAPTLFPQRSRKVASAHPHAAATRTSASVATATTKVRSTSCSTAVTATSGSLSLSRRQPRASSERRTHRWRCSD
jgi:hypothetical protein